MEDFITYELAVKLKEKGYKQGYNVFGYKPVFSDENTIKFISDIGAYENEYFGINIPCPRISQVLKWLREEKLILIGLSPMQGYDGNEMIEWWSTIYKADKQGGMSWMEELYYESYEQAALAGIEYVLDNLI